MSAMVFVAAVLARWQKTTIWAMMGKDIGFTLLGGRFSFLYTNNCQDILMSSFPPGSKHGSRCPNVENTWPTAQRAPSTVQDCT
jgi:hypothetical protein